MAIEMRAFVALQRIPIAARRVPGLALGRSRPAFEIGIGLLVGGDHAGAGAALDRHVADCHAPFHGKRADGRAAELDDRAGAARRADLADDGEHDVLGGDALLKRAVHLDHEVLRLLLDQGLGCQHMLDLRGADAMRQRAEGAMRRRVAVAADDGRSRQREALLRPDDMDDALAAIGLVEILDAEIPGVHRQRLDLDAAFVVVDALGPVSGGHIVIDDGQRLFGRPHLAIGQPQAFKGLWRRHFMDEVAVDIEEAGSIRLFIDEMIVPDLVVKRARLHAGSQAKMEFRQLAANNPAMQQPSARGAARPFEGARPWCISP